MQVMPDLDHAAGGDQALAIAKGLAGDGWHVILVAARTGIEREARANGIDVETVPVDRQNPLTIWLNSRWIRRLAQSRNVQLIHAFDPASAWSGALAARALDIAFLSTIDGLPPANGRSWSKRFWQVMVEGDRAIVSSERQSDLLLSQGLLDAARLRLIRPGIDLTSFDPSTVRGHRLASLSERWQLSLDHRIVLAPGRIEAGGGHLDLLRAMALNGQKDWQLLIIGSMNKGSSYVRSLERAILAEGLSDRVVFGGICEDMAAAIMMSELVVFAADHDGWGEGEHVRLAVAAQAMGKPVLVTDRGGLPEAVQPASTGWLASAGDALELSRSIGLALQMDQDVKERLAERARAFAADDFGLATAVRKLSGLYKELAKQPPSKAGSVQGRE